MTALALRITACVPCRVRRLCLLSVFVVLNLLHPFIHGTPLDGGALDTFMAWLNSQAMTTNHSEEESP